MGALFAVSDWCASVPGITMVSPHRLAADMATDVSFLPAMRRRRLSKLSKLSLRLAHECAPGYQGYCVFGSQHGELVTTQALLESIVQNEVVSPAGFSASVHNTAVGLHSINNHNTSACNSIAAGRDTLAMCFIEAWGMLASGAAQVLVVYADDSVPAPLDEYLEGSNVLHGLAALVHPPQAGETALALTQAPKQSADIEAESLETLMHFLIQQGERRPAFTRGETLDWRWQYHA